MAAEPYYVTSTGTGLTSTVQIDFAAGTFMNPEGHSFVVAEGEDAGITRYFAMEGTVTPTGTAGEYHWEGDDGSQGWFDTNRGEWGLYYTLSPRMKTPPWGKMRMMAHPLPPVMTFANEAEPDHGTQKEPQEYTNTRTDQERARKKD